jgi:hypothetical protein
VSSRGRNGRILWPFPPRMVGIVLVEDPRMARGRQLVAGHLDQPVRTPRHHHQLVALHPAPHLVTDPGLGQRVSDRTEPACMIVSTIRVSPYAAVNASVGNGCILDRSSTSISVGGRRVSACGRTLTAPPTARTPPPTAKSRPTGWHPSGPDRPWRPSPSTPARPSTGSHKGTHVSMTSPYAGRPRP